MDSLRATYRDDEDDNVTDRSPPSTAVEGGATSNTTKLIAPEIKTEPLTENGVKDEPMVQSEDNNLVFCDEIELKIPPKFMKRSPKAMKVTPTSMKISETTEEDDDEEDDEEDDDDEEPPAKKQKPLSSLATPTTPKPNPMVQPELQEVQLQIASQPEEIIETPLPKSASKSSGKKSAKKKNNNNVWTRPTSRKGKKKAKNNQNNGNNNNNNNNNNTSAQPEDRVLITPIPRFPDKNDDSPEMKICLSKFYKAEKVEIGEDRLSAGSTKGYRMVRATRGVVEGAWYFEIKVVHLGETGHTRLGWSTDKGDLQAPVGFDANSFGYRDVDGSKVHKALREKYGEEGYREGDVLGFYISLPEGNLYAPNPPRYVWYKGQRYVCAPDAKEDPPKVVPGSEMCFFKNGICQGTAFKDLYGGRYYPAASMYTLPNQPNCVVRFNFGPEFEFFPKDFGERPAPRPMIEVPYHGVDGKVENGSTKLCPLPVVTEEQGTGCPLPVVTEEQGTACPLPVVTEEQGTACSLPVVTEEQRTACPLPVVTEEQGTACPLPVVTEEQGTACPLLVVTEEQGTACPLPVVTEEQGTACPLPVVTAEQGTLCPLPVVTAEQGIEVVEPSHEEQGVVEPSHEEQGVVEPSHEEQGVVEPSHEEQGTEVGEPSHEEQGTEVVEPSHQEQGTEVGEPSHEEQGTEVVEPSHQEQGTEVVEPSHMAINGA